MGTTLPGAVGIHLNWAVAAGIVTVLLLANAVFVAVEFALVTSRRADIIARAERGDRRARMAAGAMRDLNRQLAGAQLGITIASVGLGFVAEPLFGSFIEPIGDALGLPQGLVGTISIVLAITFATVIHMVVGEMVPKNVAITAPEQTLLTLVAPYRLFVLVARPVLALTNGLAQLVLHVLRVSPRNEIDEVHTADEIASMIALAREGDIIEDFAHTLMAGALDLGRRPVGSVMVPAAGMVTVPRDLPVAEIEETIVRTGHSRLPVVGGSADDVDGFVHAKDLLAIPEEDRSNPVPQPMIQNMLVVSPDDPLEAVLRMMRRARRHLALVRDRDGHTRGLVTLEDVLEALVGDIRDESDRPVRAGRGGARRASSG